MQTTLFGSPEAVVKRSTRKAPVPRLPAVGDYPLTDEQHVTAAEKASALRAWIRFLAGDFKRRDFTRGLYQALYLWCSFIAHYGPEGFYAEYFENPADTEVFLSQFDPDGPMRAVEGAWWDWKGPAAIDLADAMCAVYGAMKGTVLPRLQARRREREVAVARAALTVAHATLARYGLEP